MKKSALIAFLAVFLLVIPLASASIFDVFGITGKAEETTIEIKEQVKCVFAGSSELQKCYTEDYKFSCSGIGSCVADVSGASGAQLTWLSSCSTKFTTTIDGTSKDAMFNCPATSSVPVQDTCTKDYICPDGTKIRQCELTAEGLCGCKAITCPSTTSTQPVETQCGNGVCDSGETASICNMDCGTPYLKEQVKCMFYESSSYQKCYAENGKFGCSGVGSCVADVSGASGAQLTWKGSCEGEGSSIIDGTNKYVHFKCAEQPTTTTPIPPMSTLAVKEQVKCLFINSDKEQECRSSEGFMCAGVGSCVADIASDNLYGKQLSWKSTCGGYAYTIADGNNEYAEFRCGELVEQPAVVRPATKKEALMYIFLEEGCKQCDAIRNFADAMKKKYGYVNANFALITASSQQAYTIIVTTYIKKGTPVIFLNNKVWNGFNDDIAKEMEAEIKLCIEKGCPLNPNPPVPDELKYYMSSFATATPQITMAKEAIPVGEGSAREQIRCIFKNSDVLLNPHTARPEKCITEDGKFGCIWDGNVEVLANGERKAYCVMMNVEGQKGAKLTWKSSCGGYSYSVIDGNNEDVDFSCIPATNVTVEQISGRGFAYAYWQCYDGKEYRQTSANCKSSETWKKEAEEFCKDSCVNVEKSGECPIPSTEEEKCANYEKCGVNSFSVSTDCYIEAGKEGVVFMPAKETTTKEIKEKETLICKDSCPFNNKCYPFGYRKADRYCSDNNAFVSQLKGEEKCDNSFECKSNVCVAGQCISENLIHKILNWFKKLFRFTEEEKEEPIECGASSDCMENAFKVCKPAKIVQGDAASEIIGLENEKCVLKITAGDKSMTCEVENYEQGTKNLDMEQYCKGELAKYMSSSLTSTQKTAALIPETETPEEESRLAQTESPLVQANSPTSACEKIRSQSLKSKCLAIINEDFLGCELVDETDRPYCYADVALVTGDSAICEKIADSSHKKACEALVEKEDDKCSGWIYADYCYRDVAALTGNTAACDRIAYSGGKADCNAVVLRNVLFCQNADSEDCYQKLALLTGDETVCDELGKIQITGERPIAIANLDTEVSKCRKMAQKDVNGCDVESGSGTDCSLIPAMAENPSLCENLRSNYPGDIGGKDICYFYAAIRRADLMSPALVALRD